MTGIRELLETQELEISKLAEEIKVLHKKIDLMEQKKIKGPLNAEEFDLNRVAEKAYKRTFWLMVMIIIGATIGNSVARWLSDNPQLELIPSNILNFIREVIYIFVIPVSIKIVGDKLPLIVEAIRGVNDMRFKSSNDSQSN
jgi:hypothetical protein